MVRRLHSPKRPQLRSDLLYSCLAHWAGHGLTTFQMIHNGFGCSASRSTKT
jgi:hypothetical protein